MMIFSYFDFYSSAGQKIVKEIYLLVDDVIREVKQKYKNIRIYRNREILVLILNVILELELIWINKLIFLLTTKLQSESQ